VKTLLIAISILLTSCVDVPDEVTVTHDVVVTVPEVVIDQCADHGEYSEINIILDLLICRDGAEFPLSK